MRFVKRSTREHPRLSFVLLDWSVRESFHILHYLADQTVDRDQFEVIVVEYYSREGEPIRQYQGQVDTWVLLEMPESYYYHKHLMYNVGIVLSRGDIVSIGDSDAMVKPTFVETILRNFEQDQNIVLHLDQFRNNRQDFYPFRFPSFKEVLGDGCINNAGGKTAGVVDERDPIHERNYGACMCARRDELIRIGGADEHLDYIGHICGPYDMTFRLVNDGCREIWEDTEFTYHTWHPGQAGAGNYLGPHDGRHVSSTSLLSLATGRIAPLVENQANRACREGKPLAQQDLLELAIDQENSPHWTEAGLTTIDRSKYPVDNSPVFTTHHGSWIYKNTQGYRIGNIRNLNHRAEKTEELSKELANLSQALQLINGSLSPGMLMTLRSISVIAVILFFFWWPLRNLKRPWEILRINRLQREYRSRIRTNDNLKNMLVTVWRWQQEKNVKPLPCLLVESKTDARLVRWGLGWLGIKHMALHKVTALNELKSVMEGLDRNNTCLFVAAGLYTRFYPEFTKTPVSQTYVT